MVLVACSDSGPRGGSDCDCTADEGCEDGVCVDGSSSSSGTQSGGATGASSSSSSTGGGGTTGCHATGCMCYEPPFHPSEIDCSSACATIGALCATDSSCWTCTYYDTPSACQQSCAGIAATWSQPNIATYLADVVYGCAMSSYDCAAMTACNYAIVAQQKTVCP